MLKTDPYYQDTDGDTLSDAEEIGGDLANPVDTDGDGIPDALEHPLFDFDRDGVPDPEDASPEGYQLVYAKFDPPVIANNGTDETRLLVKLVRAESVTAVSARWDATHALEDLSPAALVIEGQPLGDGRIELFDDGTHCDWIAGDGVWSRGGIRTTHAPREFAGRRDVLAINQLAVTDAGGDHEHPFADVAPGTLRPVPGRPLLVRVNEASVPNVARVDAQTQKSPHVLNLVDRERSLVLKKRMHGHNASIVAARPNYSTWLTMPVFAAHGGDFEFLFFFSPSQDFARVAGMETTVGSPERGIGDLVVTPISAFGTAGRLRSILQMHFGIDPPMNHEVAHSWAVRLDRALGFDATPHWGWSGANGLLGDFDPASLVDHGDGTFSMAWFNPYGNPWHRWVYSPLELYLMGLAAAGEVGPIPSLHDVQLLSNNGVTFTVRANLTTITIDDIIARHGARNPAFPDARSDFAAAFVIVSDRPATPAEMGLVEQFALEFGSDRAESVITFRQATGDRATVDTRMP
jgi:hypothetical protein